MNSFIWVNDINNIQLIFIIVYQKVCRSGFYKESASAPVNCIQGIGIRIHDEGPDPPEMCL